MTTTSRSLLLALGASEGIRLSRWHAPLRRRANSAASPAAVAALIRDVEREPELVPSVRHVTVLERGGADRSRQTVDGSSGHIAVCRLPSAVSPGDGWVRYQVQGTTCGLPWTVRFCKWWEGEDRFWWRSEGGTGCPEQAGAIWLLSRGSGCRIELRVRTRSALPLLGGLATLLVNPFFLAPTFAGWLENLARVAEAEASRAVGRGSAVTPSVCKAAE